MTDSIIEKARQPKAQQVPSDIFITRGLFRFYDPSSLSPEQWRLVAREPVNKMAQRFIQREVSSLAWEITSKKKNDARVDDYYERWEDIFEDGQGFIVWLSRMVEDACTLTFGAASEVGRDGEDLAWVQHVDGATLAPTYNRKTPYVQINPDNWMQRIYFKRGELVRLQINARPEIRWKEYQVSPTEDAFLSIEALSKIYLYYMQELTDTPAMGILDLMDLTGEEAKKWAKNFREMMQGVDPLKIPVLYDHSAPANWIPFNRSPADLNILELFKRFAEITLAKYGLSIGDLRLFEHESTKAGERVSQLVTERSGIGYWAALFEDYITKILPSGLIFAFKQPRPERDKLEAETQAVRIDMLQKAAGGKQLVSVKDAVEEAKALEIFMTEVTPKEEQEGPPPGLAGLPGQPGGPETGTESQEMQDTRADQDLSKGLVLNLKALYPKGPGAAWGHPARPVPSARIEATVARAFRASGQAVDPQEIEELQEAIKTHLEALGEEAPAELKAEYRALHLVLEDLLPKTSITDATESCLHRAFTVLFDQLFLLGYIDRETRMAASGVIGDWLPEISDALRDAITNNLEIGPDDLRLLAKSLTEEISKGGPGSGHWGHAGRPGERGGSAAGGGLATIGAQQAHTALARQAISQRYRRIQGRDSGRVEGSAGVRQQVAAAQERAAGGPIRGFAERYASVKEDPEKVEVLSREYMNEAGLSDEEINEVFDDMRSWVTTFNMFRHPFQQEIKKGTNRAKIVHGWTQEVLRGEGVDSLVLHRGVGKAQVKQMRDNASGDYTWIGIRPASSWSESKKTAMEHAAGGGAVISGRFPAESAFASYRAFPTVFGSSYESEIILVAGKQEGQLRWLRLKGQVVSKE